MGFLRPQNGIERTQKNQKQLDEEKCQFVLVNAHCTAHHCVHKD